ncbi:MAG: hypothetical protein AB2L14_04665 [Candidatus Xenobiia bacterium LiM19]
MEKREVCRGRDTVRRSKAHKASGGFSFIELLVAISIAMLLFIIASPQLARTSKDKSEAKAAAMKLADDLRYLRQRAITTRMPAALIIPTGDLTYGHFQHYCMKEGYVENKTLADVNYSSLYRDVSLFIGVWDLDTEALHDSALTTGSGAIKRYYNNSGYQIMTWAKMQRSYTFLFTPEGGVVTNINMPHFDNAYHIVVGQYFTYGRTSTPSGAEAAGVGLNTFFKLNSVWSPVYTVTITPLGEVSISTGVLAAESSIYVDSPPQGPGKTKVDAIINGPCHYETIIRDVTMIPEINFQSFPPSTAVDATVMPGGHIAFAVSATSTPGEPLTLSATATGGSFSGGSVKCPMEFRPVSADYCGVIDWHAPSAAAAGTKYAVTLKADSINSCDQFPLVVEVLGGRRIFYESGKSGLLNIYSMNPDGTDQKNVTNSSSYCANPFISYDGSKVTYISNQDGQQNVFIMNIDGTNQVNLTHSSTEEHEPSFSPDDSKIAFSRLVNHGGGYSCTEVFTMNTDGSDVKQLTDLAKVDGDPVWSPDGTKIAFSSMRALSTDIWIMNPDGSSPQNLTKSPVGVYNLEPYWTPDSASILFNRVENANGDISIMKRDGTEVRSLTDSNFPEGDPAVSTDGRMVIYYRDAQIYRMNIDGTNVVNLTDNGNYNGSPTW